MSQIITRLALMAVAALVTATPLSAQTFIPQTRAIPGDTNYRMTDSAGRRIVGSPGVNGNMGLPMRDTYGERPARGNSRSTNGNTGRSGGFGQVRDANGAAVDWRGNTIFQRGNYAPQTRGYQTQFYYQPAYSSGINTAQLEQSVRQFAQAVQQVRQNRIRRSAGAASAANGTLFPSGRRW